MDGSLLCDVLQRPHRGTSMPFSRGRPPRQLPAETHDARDGATVVLTSLREKLIKIGAKVVRHGRYVAFQMAEVAVPRQMFADILPLIAQLGRRLRRHEGQREKRSR